MDDGAELAALRRRAYGPDADIAGDPAAVARLNEFEHRLGAQPASRTNDGACILITAQATVSRCVSADDQARGALFVSVPFAQVRETERPVRMTAEQSLGFWWMPGDTVLVLTGRTVDTVSP